MKKLAFLVAFSVATLISAAASAQTVITGGVVKMNRDTVMFMRNGGTWMSVATDSTVGRYAEVFGDTTIPAADSIHVTVPGLSKTTGYAIVSIHGTYSASYTPVSWYVWTEGVLSLYGPASARVTWYVIQR